MGRQRYLLIDGDRRRLAYAVTDRGRTWVFLDGQVSIIEDGASSGGRDARRHHHEERTLSAPMPATVIAVSVSPGDRVSRGDVLITLEAMKMELPLLAPRDGTVIAVACRPGDLVQPGVTLIEID